MRINRRYTIQTLLRLIKINHKLRKKSNDTYRFPAPSLCRQHCKLRKYLRSSLTRLIMTRKTFMKPVQTELVPVYDNAEADTQSDRGRMQNSFSVHDTSNRIFTYQ